MTAKLISSAITSLDRYVADEQGNFDWSVPDDEVHAFVNDQERRVGTYLYGRRMYGVMIAWETMDVSVGGPVLAAEAIRAGLVDEIHLFVSPIVVGGGNPALPADVNVELELLDERRFANGVVHLRYSTGPDTA